MLSNCTVIKKKGIFSILGNKKKKCQKICNSVKQVVLHSQLAPKGKKKKNQEKGIRINSDTVVY